MDFWAKRSDFACYILDKYSKHTNTTRLKFGIITVDFIYGLSLKCDLNMVEGFEYLNVRGAICPW